MGADVGLGLIFSSGYSSSWHWCAGNPNEHKHRVRVKRVLSV